MDRARFRGCLVVAGCLLSAAGCAGHRVTSTFEELEPRMKEGQTIYVTSAGGDVRRGRPVVGPEVFG